MLTIAPPLNMNPYWLGAHPSYTLSKYGMTLLCLGWPPSTRQAASVLAACGHRLISLRRRWPTCPDFDHPGRLAQHRDHGRRGGRILIKPAAEVNGQCFIDAEVLAEAGVTDLSRYGGGDNPILDIFVDKP